MDVYLPELWQKRKEKIKTEKFNDPENDSLNYDSGIAFAIMQICEDVENERFFHNKTH